MIMAKNVEIRAYDENGNYIHTFNSYNILGNFKLYLTMKLLSKNGSYTCE